MILVTGATGNAGSQVVRALLEQHRDVRAFVRDADKARGLFDDAAELAVGNFDDPEFGPPGARRRGDGPPPAPDDPRRVGWETAVSMRPPQQASGRIVKLSSIMAEPGAPVAFWDWHGQIEQYLRKSGVPAVMLRSSFFMTNLFAAAGQVAHEGRFSAPAADARIAMIDPRDIGAAAAAVLPRRDLPAEPTF